MRVQVINVTPHIDKCLSQIRVDLFFPFECITYEWEWGASHFKSHRVGMLFIIMCEWVKKRVQSILPVWRLDYCDLFCNCIQFMQNITVELYWDFCAGTVDIRLCALIYLILTYIIKQKLSSRNVQRLFTLRPDVLDNIEFGFYCRVWTKQHKMALGVSVLFLKATTASLCCMMRTKTTAIYVETYLLLLPYQYLYLT